MALKSFLSVALVVAGLSASPVSAALVQITFADPADAAGTRSISGQLTLDTSTPGTLFAGDLHDFGAAALVSFDAVVTEIASGATLATLGVNFGAPTGAIRVQQGFCCGAGNRAGWTGLGVDLVSVSGQTALTGANGNLTFQLSTGDVGGGSVNYLPDLLYGSSDTLLGGIKNSPPIDRDNFDNFGVLFGWTGVTLTGLPSGNAFWQLGTVSIKDVTRQPPVSAVPLPAGGALLLAGVGALGLVSRRRNG